MFWSNKTMGVYDPVKKIYRRDNSPFFRKGISDILGVFQGKPLAIEVKSPKGYPSPEQKVFLADFEKHGGIAILARSLIDVIKVLDPQLLLIKE